MSNHLRFFVGLMVLVGCPSLSLAQDPQGDPRAGHSWDDQERPQDRSRTELQSSKHHSMVQVSFRSGYFLGAIDHPEFLGRRAEGLVIEADLGVEINPKWSVGLQLSAMSMPVNRVASERYEKSSSNRSRSRARKKNANSFRAGCLDCAPPLEGGEAIAAEMATYIAGPRVEFSPMGSDGEGIYFGGTVGVGSIVLVQKAIGGAFAFRTGYRYYIGPRVGLSISGGMKGVFAERSRAWMPFAGAELRFR